MSAVSFRVLGPLEVAVGGRTLALGGPKPRMLLATLLLHPNATVSTDLLADVLWPTQVPQSAAANIRTYISDLRKRLATGGQSCSARIRRQSSGYVLTVGTGEVDMDQFTDRLADAQRAVSAGAPETALCLLDDACALWRGRVLEDLPPSHVWSSTLARLTELRLTAQEQRLRIRIDRGQHEDAVAELRGLLSEHPLREELWRLLVIALRAGGRSVEALRACGQAEQTLRAELDAEPGPRLRQLHRELLRTADAADPADPAAGSPPVCQLPLDLTDFTGRDAVVTALVDQLRRRDTDTPAIVVLSGAPGVGKSAVATRVAHAVRAEYPDGQLHVDLAGTSPEPRTPMDVLAELLRALGTHDVAIPRTLAERTALLRSRLAHGRTLLVLDDAASTAQVYPLLPGAGGCAVLVTSRVMLPDLVGARPIELDVLPEPEAARLLERLIGPARARSEPDSAAAILRFCGYLPLAIRVAGARLRHRRGWTLRTLADRLRDERGRLDELRIGDLAVRASVALSYAQLPDDAARALRWLSLLGPRRWPGWVVGALLGTMPADRSARADAVLDSLVDAHLVELVGSDATGAPRYRLHDLLRCYAAELAERDPVADRRAALRRVLTSYLSLAVAAAHRMPIHFLGVIDGLTDGVAADGTPPDTDTLVADPIAWFKAERGTCVAAVALAESWGVDDLAWRLAAAFTPYFDACWHQDGWHRTHEIALAAARRAGDRYGIAIVQRNLGQILLYQDDYVAAQDSFDESHRLFRALSDDRGAGIALASLGTVLRIRGRHDRALDHCHQALALFEKVGDPHGEAVARLAAGSVWLEWGCLAAAKRWFTDAHELAAAIGDRHREAHALKRLALLHQQRGDLGAATARVERASAIFSELGDEHCVGYTDQQLGELSLYTGEFSRAGRLLVDSLRMHRRNGDRRSAAEVAELLGLLHDRLGESHLSHGYYEQAHSIRAELTRP